MSIVFPPVSDDKISADLRYLTEVLVVNGLGDQGHVGGILGGEFGYGVPYENETFLLHPFCWCERSDCAWCLSCECGEDAERYFLRDGSEVDAATFFDHGGYGSGSSMSVAERQCTNCREGRRPAPNFLHRSSGTRVRWYKYIGRDNEVDLAADWTAVMSDCLVSLARPAAPVPA